VFITYINKRRFGDLLHLQVDKVKIKITIVILASVPERNPSNSFYLNVYGDFDLEWNGKGEIVYRGHNIQYEELTLYPDIPEPTGLSIFIKGLAELEIDKSL
jgi:hypothetical protein